MSISHKPKGAPYHYKALDISKNIFDEIETSLQSLITACILFVLYALNDIKRNQGLQDM